ncbi:acyltransferase family protein [Enterovirga rhinocerotis]|uniref:acyltransferase family protein n=1 Tax=Enterovirga rhinocerotis TaxID=1339210 RepID=UPI001FE019F4|nr:acyltransferase family protein [Enterovirga rhinocerotis]
MPTGAAPRLDWVDTAKGICIVLVVMMHATLGVEAAMGREGFMHWAVAFSKPFRMPDFFLLSGLFLSRVIDRPWRVYADKRVLHFAYFYVLWLVIQSAVKFSQVSDGTIVGFLQHLAVSMVEPFSTLWFVYLLAVFSVVTKLLRPVPGLVVLAAAALLQMAPIETGYLLIDEFCERWVFFLAGYLFADRIFRLAEFARTHVAASLAGLGIWAVINGGLAFTPASFLGATTLAELPGISLLLGLAGAAAIVVIGVLLTRARVAEPLRYAGSKSIAIYLTFFLPMAFTRLLLTRYEVISDPGIVAAIVTLVAVLFPLLCERLVRGTRFGFLYERPSWARLTPKTGQEPPLSPPAEQPKIDLSRALRSHRGEAAA